MTVQAFLKNSTEFINAVEAKKAKAVRELQNGLKTEGMRVMRESLKIVPRDTGNLAASWFIRPKGKGTEFDVELGYTAAYAIYVHENLEAAHGQAYNEKYKDEIKAGTKSSRGVRQQAKFLTKPLGEMRPAIIRRLKARLQNALS